MSNSVLHFDGIDDFVNLGTKTTQGFMAITIEAWIYRQERAGKGWEEIWSKESVNSFSVNHTNNKLHVNFGNGRGWGRAVESIASIPFNQWVHVAATRNLSGKVSIYVNGNLDNAGVNEHSGSNDHDRAIGTKPNAPADHAAFSGSISEIRIWDRSRSDDAIRATYKHKLSGNEEGLIHFYTFDEGELGGNNSSLTTLEDKGARKANGTLKNFSLNGDVSNWIAGPFLSFGCPQLSNREEDEIAALGFDGVDDYVNLGTNATEGFQAITIEAWVYREEREGAGWEEIWSKELVNSFSIHHVNDRLHVNFGDGSRWGSPVESISAIPFDQWTHIAATRTVEGNVQVYVNGLLENTGSNNLSGTNNLFRGIGLKANVPNAVSAFCGAIAEIRIWDHARTQTQLKNGMFVTHSGTEAGLLSLYLFNQGNSDEDNGQVTNLTDKGPAGINGTLTNFSLAGKSSNWTTRKGEKFTPISTDVTGGWVSGVEHCYLVPIHMSMLSDGRIFSFGSPFLGDQYDNMHMGGDAVIWDPRTSVAEKKDNLFSTDSFCSSTKYVNNRLVVVGGNAHDNMEMAHGEKSTIFFNDATDTVNETETKELSFARWYSSLVVLNDKRLLTIGGSEAYCQDAFKNNGIRDEQISETPEVYENGAWTQITGARNSEVFGRQKNEWWYPRAYLAPDGKVFGVSGDRKWILDPADTGSVTLKGNLTDHFVGASGTSVMFEPGKIAFIGGGQRNNGDMDPGYEANDKLSILEYAEGELNSRTGPAMTYPRNWSTATILPTGEVAVIGGTQVGNRYDPEEWVPEIEIWKPPTTATGEGAWRTQAQIKKPRLYHSAAVLLTDGTVLIGGGGVPPIAGEGTIADGSQNIYYADTPYRDQELYFPSYLFKEDGSWAKRPQISPTEDPVGYGKTFKIRVQNLDAGDRITKISLISIPSVTHSHNNDQRFAALTFVDNQDGTLSVTIPNDKNNYPPGYYMLFALNSNEVPSEALFLNGKLVLLD